MSLCHPGSRTRWVSPEDEMAVLLLMNGNDILSDREGVVFCGGYLATEAGGEQTSARGSLTSY